MLAPLFLLAVLLYPVRRAISVLEKPSSAASVYSSSPGLIALLGVWIVYGLEIGTVYPPPPTGAV